MSISAECSACGAQYRAPQEAAGKRIKCKRCGSPVQFQALEEPHDFTPPQFQEQFADLDALAGGRTVETPRPTSVEPPEDHAAVFALGGGRRSAPLDEGESDFTGAAAYMQYLLGIWQSVAAFRKPHNVITFVVVWLALGAGHFMQIAGLVVPMPCCMLRLGLILGLLLVLGWYMGFQLNLVQCAAAGEGDLPRLSAEEGLWDGVVVPFFQMLVTYICAALPVGIFLGVVAAATLGAMPNSRQVIGLLLVALGSLFAWPMMVLVVSCGNTVLGLLRLDLMLWTIVRSLPAYLLTLVAVYVAFGIRFGIGIMATAAISASGHGIDWTSIVVLPVLLLGVGVFFDVIAMRAIGNYYRCFKEKFAWSWG